MEVLLNADVFLVIDAVLAIGLATWLLRLALHPRPLAEHMAFVAATLYPSLLGLLEVGLELYHFMTTVGATGGNVPRAVFDCWRLSLLALITGLGITCLYFPLGIIAVVMHQRLLQMDSDHVGRHH